MVDYLAKHHRSRHPLPEVISIGQGRIVRTQNPEWKEHFEKLQDEVGEGGVQYLSPPDQEAVAREAADIEAEAQAVEARLRSYREALEQYDLDAAAAISEDREPGPRTRERLTRPRGPKRLGFPWFALPGYVAVAFVIIVEVAQLTLPFLDLMGIDTTNPAELSANPVAVLLGVASALAVTSALIFVWHLLVGSAVDFCTEWETVGPVNAVARLAWLLVLCVTLFFGTLLVANLRHGAATGVQDAALSQNTSSPGAGVFVFMTLLLPAGAAYISFKVNKSPYWQHRAEFQAQKAREELTVDQLNKRPDQRADAREILAGKLTQCLQEQAAIETRRKALTDRLTSHRNEWLKGLHDELEASAIFVRTLRAALVLDRYYFLCAANRSHAMHLVPNEHVCLSPESPGGAFRDGNDAPSQNGKAPAYRVARPLLTEGHWHEL